MKNQAGLLFILLTFFYPSAKVQSQPQFIQLKPCNQPSARHEGYSAVKYSLPEIPGFILKNTKIKKEGIILGPNQNYDALFNPAAWVAVDPRDGKEKVFLAPRAERDQPNEVWKKISEAPLMVSEDGRRFTLYSKGAWLKATEEFELKGGTEDARYADLRLQPFIDQDGSTFDAAMMYTAYGGTTARIAILFFNHQDPLHTRKKGLVFKDTDVMKNPLVPSSPAWNKSMAMKQIRDSETGKITNFYFFGEGNVHHGGIMALQSDLPFSSQKDGSFGLTFPLTQPVLKSRLGFFDQGLVEAAHQPEVVRLSPKLSKNTGEKFGLLLSYHGDTPPWGYSVGYALFSLHHFGAPIYRSKGPYLKPTRKLEKFGQVDRVVFNSAMVRFKGEILMYYGSADSYISVASALEASRDDVEKFISLNDCKQLLHPKL